MVPEWTEAGTLVGSVIYNLKLLHMQISKKVEDILKSQENQSSLISDEPDVGN